MELKKAIAVCLISLCSATLVLLIARSLDVQSASRLEPRLKEIAEELRAIRKTNGIPAVSPNPTDPTTAGNGLTVFFFHGDIRCPTCRAIESQSLETVLSYYASQWQNGAIVWKVLNYEQPDAAALTKEFEIIVPTVVLAKMKSGRIDDWKRLDKVWTLVGDKSAFAKYLRDEIDLMLQPE
jgi:hypothetical protein